MSEVMSLQLIFHNHTHKRKKERSEHGHLATCIVVLQGLETRYLQVVNDVNVNSRIFLLMEVGSNLCSQANKSLASNRKHL